MIISSRRLESALGDGNKKIEDNEKDTVVLQRRSIRAKRNIKKGEIIKLVDFEFQRPCPQDALKLNDFDKYLGKKLRLIYQRMNILNMNFLKNDGYFLDYH